MIYFFNLIFLTLFLSVANADPLWSFCNENTNITVESEMSCNIDTVLAQMVSDTTSTSYTATTYGTYPDKVYGLAQCREDVSEEDCSNCIEDAADEIRQRCPNQANARIWYDYCFLRYNKEAFAGKVDTWPGLIYYNVDKVSEPESFNRKLRTLMGRIRYQTFLVVNKGLGKNWTDLSTFSTLYGLVQCTRDLTRIGCAQCMDAAVRIFPQYCRDKKGCRVLYSSCYVRYELYPFFFPLDSH